MNLHNICAHLDDTMLHNVHVNVCKMHIIPIRMILKDHLSCGNVNVYLFGQHLHIQFQTLFSANHELPTINHTAHGSC